MKKGLIYKTKKRVKILNYLMIIIIPLIFLLFLKMIYIPTLKHPELDSIVFLILSIFFSLMLSNLIYLSSKSIIWNKVFIRKNNLEKEKFKFYYNRCITGLRNKEFDKVYFIYNNILRFKNKPIVNNIKFGYRLLSNYEIDMEYL